MYRKKSFSAEEIANLLRELSENESDGGDLSFSELDSDNEILLQKNESEKSGECDMDDNSIQMNYNILDIAAINAWIVYKSVSGKQISRKCHIQQLVNELRSNYVKVKKCATTQNYVPELNHKRKKCEIKMCKGNATNRKCSSCLKMACGKCTEKVAYYYKNCK